MGTEISPMTVRLRELVDDGAWHPRESVVRALVGTVPPGVAWRKAEQMRLADRRRRGLPQGPRVHHTARQTAVLTGARAVIAEVIGREIKRGNLERRRNGNGIELRSQSR